ncbi:MAG: signal peptidase I [Clostridiales bacterium]|nr:signal peptidase I [Clostridiales bacterium]
MPMSEQENLQPVTAEEAKATGKTKKSKQKKPWQREVLEWVITLSVAVVLALTVRTFLFELVRVDGASMNPTLKDGEIMFVSKPCYVFGGNPERFDIVICHYPERGNTNFVKRVVGIPGDTLEIRDGYLMVNGVIYPEDYLAERPYSDYGPYTVGEGEYLVMGDNRNNSNDSRNPRVGPISRDMIVGRVESVLWHTMPEVE